MICMILHFECNPLRCFSAEVFFLARQDGRLDVWDYFYRMNEVALTQQVSDRALTSLKLGIGIGFRWIGWV